MTVREKAVQKIRKRMPQSTAEWQEAVDLAYGALALVSARQYGLVLGGPRVNVRRCERVLALGKERGFVPSEKAIDKFISATLYGDKPPSAGSEIAA